MLLALPAPSYWQQSRGLGQTPSQVQSLIASAAASYPGVPNLTTVAMQVATHESGLQPAAQNPSSSACGLFQLLSVTQQTLGVTSCTNAQQNVDAGVSLLASYYQKYGNWPDALQAFSDGPGTVASGLAPSDQTLGLISYVESNGGLDFGSVDGSTGFDLSSLGIDLPGFTLPDFSSFSISETLGIPDVPDWVTWLGIGIAGAGAVMLLTRS